MSQSVSQWVIACVTVIIHQHTSSYIRTHHDVSITPHTFAYLIMPASCLHRTSSYIYIITMRSSLMQCSLVQCSLTRCMRCSLSLTLTHISRAAAYTNSLIRALTHHTGKAATLEFEGSSADDWRAAPLEGWSTPVASSTQHRQPDPDAMQAPAMNVMQAPTMDVMQAPAMHHWCDAASCDGCEVSERVRQLARE